MVKIAATLLFGICGLGLMGWKHEARVHTFSELPSGNVLQIHFHSSGCFNQNDYDFTFRSGAQPTIDLVDSRNGGKLTFPRLTLTGEDVRMLDSTLEYYRAVKGGSCTTLDTVRITEVRGKQVMGTETYEDRTCSVWGKKADLLTFQELQSRIKGAKAESPESR
jgi:hypothetical protein